MARMDKYALLLEQFEGEVFVRVRGRNTEYDIPSGFADEARTIALRSELFVKRDKVGLRAGKRLILELRARFNQNGKRTLDWRIHREVRIRDDVKALARVGFEMFRPGEHDPCAFHLRQAAEF